MNGNFDEIEVYSPDSTFQSSFARALAQASVRKTKHNNNVNNNNNQQLVTIDQQCLPVEEEPDNLNNDTAWQLKEECQRLLEENRRLRASAMLSPLNNDHEQRAEVALLQSRVNTLSWQLSQAESSKRVLKTVSEQVVSFLDRVTNTMSTLEKQRPTSRSGCRVPRSRSTHTVAEYSQSVRETPEPREFVPRSSLARSGSDVHASSSSTVTDFTWRRNRDRNTPSPLDEEAANPARLGQQAKRLARTLRSMLSTQEPDLASNNSTASSSPSSETSSTALNTSFSHLLRSSRRRLSYDQDPLSMNNSRTSNFLQQLTADSADSSPILSSRALRYREETLTTSTTISIPNNKSPEPELSIYIAPTLSITSSNSSNSSSPTRKQDNISADESGFSSLGSFQEIGLPITYPQNGLPYSKQQNGLPNSSSINHMRCRSTPVTTKTKHSYYRSTDAGAELSTIEKLKVLWV